MEKLSVIVPVYNVYPYLRECLDSIINQTYKNLEIIIVNDASPYIEDDEICKEYASKDERIIYIKHKENKKQGGARNTGIKAATGKYITFVDSDDYLSDLNVYEEIINIIEKNKYELIIADYSVLDENGILHRAPGADKYYNKGNKINPDKFPIGTMWNKIFKTEDLKNNNIYFLENTKFEDSHFWYNYILKINPVIVHTNKIIYVYRINQASTTHQNISILDTPVVFSKIYDLLKEHNKVEKYRKITIQDLYGYSPNVWKLDDETRKQYTKDYKDYLKYTGITPEIIRKYGTINFITQFIEDDEIRKMCQEILAPFKDIDNKIIPENKYIYKIKRETMRVFKQKKYIS